MGDLRGFLEVKRQELRHRQIKQRLKDFHEVIIAPRSKESQQQASRCMDCGTPFCHWGCPLGSYIPEWNDLVYRGHWQKAFEILDATNNLAEITARVCPAMCEYACVLGINDDPVTIRQNELAIIEYGFKKGLFKANMPKRKSNKKIAIVGSGPAGLSCANQLNKAGHNVVIFEKDDKVGGILRYGIPDFKLEKWVLDRHIDLLKQRGIEFAADIEIGKDFSSSKLLRKFDAVCLTGGSRIPHDLKIKGREAKGIYFAMDYLIQANRRVAGQVIPKEKLIDAKDKNVLVIGGGDTGADCVGVARRQRAASVVQIEIMPKPPLRRTENYPWPEYPVILKTSTSHEEGVKRKWSILTKEFIADDGCVKKVRCVKVNFSTNSIEGHPIIKELLGSEFEIDAGLVILAVGFLYPERKGLLKDLKIRLDKKGNVKTNEGYMTSKKRVFCAGDMRRGQSLVVWAISEGRRAAHYIDRYLTGKSYLPLI